MCCINDWRGKRRGRRGRREEGEKGGGRREEGKGEGEGIKREKYM